MSSAADLTQRIEQERRRQKADAAKERRHETQEQRDARLQPKRWRRALWYVWFNAYYAADEELTWLVAVADGPRDPDDPAKLEQLNRALHDREWKERDRRDRVLADRLKRLKLSNPVGEA